MAKGSTFYKVNTRWRNSLMGTVGTGSAFYVKKDGTWTTYADTGDGFGIYCKVAGTWRTEATRPND
jgi:hypothetical protein